MLAVATNSFYSNSNIEELFEKVNKELANVTNLCVTNNFSTNTRNKLINKRLGIDPLKLPDVKLNKLF